jgi:hypothetical protein
MATVMPIIQKTRVHKMACSVFVMGREEELEVFVVSSQEIALLGIV